MFIVAARAGCISDRNCESIRSSIIKFIKNKLVKIKWVVIFECSHHSNSLCTQHEFLIITTTSKILEIVIVTGVAWIKRSETQKSYRFFLRPYCILSPLYSK